jgi:hypothetical protein
LSVIASGTGESESSSSGGTSTKTVSSDDLTKGYYVYLTVDGKLKFTFCGAPYYIKLTDADTDEDKAAFTITPVINGIVMKEGTSERLDLNSDNSDDILFRLESVSTDRAKVYIKRISDSCTGAAKTTTTDLTSANNVEKLLPREESSNLVYAAGFLAVGILLSVFAIILNSMGVFSRR